MSEPTEEREPQAVSFPTTLYFQHPERGMLHQTFDDQGTYEAARAAGWHSSPASFGVETHPSQPGLAAATASGDVRAPASVDLSDVMAVVLAMQVQHEQVAQTVRDLTTRLEALEAFVQALPTRPSPPPAEVARTTTTHDDDPPHRTTTTHDDDPPHRTGRRT